MIKNQEKYQMPTTIAGFDGHLRLSIGGTEYFVQIIDISESSLSVLMDERLNSLVPEATPMNDVDIFMNNRPWGTINLVFNEKMQLKTLEDEVFLNIADVADKKSAYKLWEIMYHHMSPQMGAPQVGLDRDNLPRVPGRGLYTEKARLERLDYIREKTGASLNGVGGTSLDAQKLTGNIEGFIGSVEVPVGIAGPLWINGANARGYYYAPMATTEGALVASATRGAMAITRSGGVTAHVLGQRMMRVPLFVLENIHSALFFASWVKDHFLDIKEETKKYSQHAELREIETLVVGKSVHVQFIYETGDASGQNMTTTCTWHASLWILKQMEFFKSIRFENFLVDGNLSNDKKVSYQSYIKGRGIRVIAETFIPADVLQQVLKVTPWQIYSCYQAGVNGAIQSGTLGLNVNIANVIAAIFTATGQDIACVHESSVGYYHLEPNDEGLYASMTLPSLVVGTVGGGTNLPHQRECLEMIDCAGPDRAYRLAEIIVSFCLALDLSTSSAIASGQFAGAHERLGRNRPVRYITVDDINTAFVNRIVRRTLGDEDIAISRLEPLSHENMGSSIITELTAQKSRKLLGHLPYRMHYFGENREEKSIDVMIKVKPTDGEVIHMMNGIATLSDARLGAELKKTEGGTGFRNCHIREIAIYEETDPRFTRHIPAVYGLYRNDDREGYIIIQELLNNMVLMDTAGDVSGWRKEHLVRAIDGIADIHSIWYGREEELKKKGWLEPYPTLARMQEYNRLWELMAGNAYNEFKNWFNEADFNCLLRKIQTLPEWWGRIESMKKTLIHNDFSPRNICFRNTPDGLRLCAYDWELATLHLPQRDVAELLAFVLPDTAALDDIKPLVEYHRKRLEMGTGMTINPGEWWEGFRCACWDFHVNRLMMYITAHTVRHYDFIERVYGSLRNMITTINGR